MTNKKIQLVILAVTTFLAYSNIFQNQFLGDDLNFFTSGSQITSLANVGKFFFEPSLPGDYAFYRPIGNVYSALNYYLWGTNPYGYHLVQLLLHIVNATLVYLIVGMIMRIKANVVRMDANDGMKWLPFVTALVFGVHPINIEVVEFMPSMMIVAFTFLFAAVLSYYRSEKSTLWYFLSIIFAALAFFSYELTLVLPFILVFSDWIFLRKVRWQKYLPYFALFGLFLFIRYFLLHIYSDVSYPGHSFYLSMLLSVKIVALYIFLLILPINLSINPIIPPGIQSLINPYTERLNEPRVLAQSIFDAEVIIGVFVIMILLFSAIWCRRKHPIITFAIGLFAISLFPVLNFLPQPALFQERYAYLASISWGLIVGYAVVIVQSAKFKVKSLERTFKTMTIVGLVGVLVFYAGRTYVRNMDWKDGVSMWSNLASQLTDDAATQYYLATLYQARGEDNSALKYYERTLRINPNVPEVYFQIGQIYQKHGQIEDAKSSYKQAIKIAANFVDAQKALDELESY